MKTKVNDLSTKWTVKQKMGFVNRMETLPEGGDNFKIKILERNGISKRKYNEWVKRYGVTSIYAPVLDGIKRVNPTVVKMFHNNDKIMYHVELSVIIKSMDELTELVTNLTNVPMVDNINSVIGIEKYLD